MKIPRTEGTVSLLLSVEPGRLSSYQTYQTNKNFDAHPPLLMSPEESSENDESLTKSV